LRQEFNYLEVAKIATVGGIIGVMFTIPLRRAFILVAKLQYPEGIATQQFSKLVNKPELALMMKRLVG
jgi:uncharacterized oligopeptide transporter (OPT) family protein